jgi:hypothetical protein
MEGGESQLVIAGQGAGLSQARTESAENPQMTQIAQMNPQSASSAQSVDALN